MVNHFYCQFYLQFFVTYLLRPHTFNFTCNKEKTIFIKLEPDSKNTHSNRMNGTGTDKWNYWRVCNTPIKINVSNCELSRDLVSNYGCFAAKAVRLWKWGLGTGMGWFRRRRRRPGARPVQSKLTGAMGGAGSEPGRCGTWRSQI